jgi:hypothetical protein
MCKKMKRAIVLLEFYQLESNLSLGEEVVEVVCVTQRAYERVLSKLCDNEFPEQIVTQLPSKPVRVRFGLGGEPFDFSKLNPNGEQTLRDILPSPPIDIVVQDIQNLWNFKTKYVQTPNDIFAQPNGDAYDSMTPPDDQHILGILEIVRCLYAQQLVYMHQPNPTVRTARTLYVRGGGQHGTIAWGALSAVLRQAEQPFDRFAGDSFGSALAVMAALDSSGSGHLFLDRVIDVCHHMNLDEEDRPLNREAALEFVQFSLHEHIHKTLGELNLPVDILVSNINTGIEHTVWNAQTMPNVTLGDALVASMSIPVFIGAHSGCFDGGLTANIYTDGLTSNSVVITLGCSSMDLTKLAGVAGACGSVLCEIVSNWQELSGQTGHRSMNGAKQILLTVLDPDVSILGGSVGTTSWHVLNFQHGFDEAISQCC